MDEEPAPPALRPNSLWATLRAHRFYGAAVGYLVVAWIILQVAAIVLPGFGAPAWVLRGLMILLALGLGVTLVIVWGRERRARGLPLLPRTPHTRLAWVLTAVLPALLVTVFFVLHPLGRSAPAVALAAAEPADKSVAVLPFENLSDDKANAYFTDGVQDQILTDLAKIADLKVISRLSVMQYKTDAPRNLREIGRQLGVAHLLIGSVQRAGNKVRVTAQLIDAHNDAHEWAENYDRPIDDVFTIQSEIAKAIADQLQAKLSPNERREIERPPTSDVAAFDLYSRGRALALDVAFTSAAASNLREAIRLFEQALARDPAFFLAQCELARAHDDLYYRGGDHTPARLALADAAVAETLRMRPEAGEAHLVHAQHLYTAYLDREGALTELRVAQRTLPNDPRIIQITGYILRRRLGTVEEGMRLLQRASELDPRNVDLLGQIAIGYFRIRRYPEVDAALDRALAITPDDIELKVIRASIDLDWKADPRPVHQALEQVRAQHPEAMKDVAERGLFCAWMERDAPAAEAILAALGDDDSFGSDAVRFHRDFGEAVVARMTHDETKARAAFTAARARQEKILQAQPDYGPALCVLALIDAGLGRKEEALREARRAVESQPLEKDVMGGATLLSYYAVVAAWVGEKDLALELLAKAVPLPTEEINYGRLKLHPFWDPLRGDPRFEAMAASLAPKP